MLNIVTAPVESHRVPNAAPSPRRGGPRPVRLGKYRYVRWRWRLAVACIDLAGGLLAACWRVMKKRTRPTPFDPQQVRRILWVQLDHLGDAVLSAAVLPALKRRFPHARLDVLAASWNREIFAAIPAVDNIDVSRRNRFARTNRRGWVFSTIWWGLKLRGRRYDLAIDPRGELPAAVLMRLAGARRRLGWVCGGGAFLLTDVADYVAGRHEIESRQALLACLGVETEGNVPGEPWIHPDAAAVQAAEQALAALPHGSGPIVALHVGAGSRAKQWPVGSWRELMGRLVVEWDARVVLVGGPADRRLSNLIAAGQAWPGVLDLTGRLSVLQTAAVLQRVDLFLGGDSGPAHLAAAVGARPISLFSGTNDPRQWRPWGPDAVVLKHETPCSPCHRERCPWADHPCMTGLEPQQVLQQIERLYLATGRPGAQVAPVGEPRHDLPVEPHRGLCESLPVQIETRP